MIGSTVSHYRILDKLGEGGMGVVYRAEDTQLGRQVALKFLPPELNRDPDAKKRFLREARAASQLQHRNICAIHEIDESDDGQLFLSMDCYEGETLQVRLKREPLSIEEVVDIAGQIAQGLAHAHDRGVVHRDLKPANVMITGGGEVKILDFGLAKTIDETRITRDGTLLGTPCYMSPEQAQGADADHRADLWSLGVVMYEMLAGRSPFQGGNPAAVIHRILKDDPVPLSVYRSDVPLELEGLVQQLLDRNLNSRLGDGAGVVEVLSGSRQTTERPRYSRTLALVATVALALVAIAVVFKSWPELDGSGESRDPRVAVMFFTNLGPPDMTNLAAGLTEDIIMSLAETDDLDVLSRSAVERYRTQTTDPRSVGSELDCDYVLEGSLRVLDDRVRIRAQLIDATNGTQLWGRSFDGPPELLFDVQDSLRSGIGAALGLDDKGVPTSAVANRWTTNVEAYAFFLAGREAYWEEAGNSEAGRWYEKALALQPMYVPALAGLSNTLVYERRNGHRFEPGGHERALNLARTAQELDRDYALAWRAEAYALEELDPDAALNVLDHAVSLNPQLPELHLTIGRIHIAFGRYEEAEARLRLCMEVDPYFRSSYALLAETFVSAGRYSDAHGILQLGLQALPSDVALQREVAHTLEAEGRREEAIAMVREITAEHPDDAAALVDLGRLLGSHGQIAAADSVLIQAAARWPSDSVLLWSIGDQLIATGNLEQAEVALRQAIVIEPYAMFARYELARCLHRAGRVDAAQAEIDYIESTWPGDYQAARMIATYYHHFAQDYAMAERWYLRSLETCPTNAQIPYALGDLYRRQARWTDGVAVYTRRLEQNPRDHFAWKQLSEHQMELGEVDAAIVAAEESLRLRPDFASGWNQLGRAHLRVGHRHQAAVAFKKAVQYSSTAATRGARLNNLAVIQLQEGRFRSAIESWAEAAELNPQTPAQGNIAWAAWNLLEDEAEARRACAAIYELADPSSRNYMTRLEVLGGIEASGGHHGVSDSLYCLAADLRETSLASQPQSATAMRNAALSNARCGNDVRARELITRIVAEHGDELRNLMGVITALALLGDHDAALEQLEKAIDLGLDTTAVVEANRDLAELRKDPRFAELIAQVW